ncbi:transglutaminase-like domain-containing protein [Cellulosilyticum sp. I15G10I2]|uniref:transglutaminase-like domain-containing protein n=1 Tax=Cellulosilyticum sp. I15G10I2 TaxID=1892843 RepID=UPI00085C2E7A|nr:transglutaminase-like domain-containing protein [Cellulosilyticum sp. I15G10I2]
MKMKQLNILRKVVDGLIAFILMGLMAFSITYIIIYGMEITYSPLKLIAIIFSTLGVLAAILMNKLTLRITLITLTVMGLLGGAYLYHKKILGDLLVAVQDELIAFGEWSINFIWGIPAGNSYYINYFVLLLGICTAGITYIFTVKKFSFLIFFLGGVSVLLFEIIKQQAVSEYAFYMFAFVCLIYFFKAKYIDLQKQLDETNEGTYRNFMKTGICIAAGILVCAALLARTYPYKAEWLHDLVDKFSHKTYYYYAAENFSVGSAGFQTDDRTLGGDITPSDVIVLEVASASPIYLKAVSKGIYTGGAWISEKEEPLPINLETQKFEDTVEMLEVIKWITDENQTLDVFFHKQRVDVTFVNISTKSVFVPSKMESFKTTSEKKDVFLMDSDALVLEEPASKGFSYTTEFYEPQDQDDLFKDMLRKSKVGFYNAIRSDGMAQAKEIDKWIAHAKMLTNTYTQLPEELPERVKALAYEITEGQETNYDKVKAIEDYLVSNYTYTLTPGNPEEGKDFVDTFLFENKKGYCIYFASAFAILTRNIGIPCRYVEGYALPQNRDSKQGVYIVTNKRAHAWVEVYFEGIGWIKMEATPPYRQVNITSQNSISMEEAISNTQTFSTIDLDIAVLKQTQVWGQRLIIMPISISAVLILSIYILYRIRKYRLMKMAPRRAICYLYRCYLKLLAFQKISITEGETEHVFSVRVDEWIDFREVTFKDITEIYLVATYSQLDITKEQKQRMIDFHKCLLKASKKRIGVLAYITWRLRYTFL